MGFRDLNVQRSVNPDNSVYKKTVYLSINSGIQNCEFFSY